MPQASPDMISLTFCSFLSFYSPSLLQNAGVGGLLCYAALVFAPFLIVRRDTLTNIHCGSFLKFWQRKAATSHPNS